jgi:hypothetical protein
VQHTAWRHLRVGGVCRPRKSWRARWPGRGWRVGMRRGGDRPCRSRWRLRHGRRVRWQRLVSAGHLLGWMPGCLRRTDRRRRDQLSARFRLRCRPRMPDGNSHHMCRIAERRTGLCRRRGTALRVGCAMRERHMRRCQRHPDRARRSMWWYTRTLRAWALLQRRGGLCGGALRGRGLFQRAHGCGWSRLCGKPLVRAFKPVQRKPRRR